MPPQQTSLAAAGIDAACRQDAAIAAAITTAITPAPMASRSVPFVATPDVITPEILSGPHTPLLIRLWLRYLAWRKQRRLHAAVHELSDEQLRDIGLTRAEVDALAGHRAAIDTLSADAMRLWLMSRGTM